MTGFKTGAALLTLPMTQEESASSPDEEPPPDKDYSDWFDSAPAPMDIGFKTASGLAHSSFTSGSAAFQKPQEDFSSNSHAPPLIGFTKASKGGGVLVPSAAAFAKAQAKLKIWQDSDDVDAPSNQPTSSAPSPPRQPPPPAPSPAPQSSRNTSSSHPPPSNQTVPSTPSEPRRSMPPPSTGIKGFRSPFARDPGATGATTPHDSTKRSHHPLSRPPVTAPPTAFASPSIMTPSRPNSKGPPAFFASTSAVTPSRPTSRGPRPAAFVTPFKQGMKPGQAGHQSLQSSLKKAIPATPKTPYSAHSSTPMASSSKVMLPTPKKKFFDTGAHNSHV